MLEEIIEKFEVEFEGKKHLFIPLDGSDSLIVCMSTHNFFDRYFYLKGMLANQKCNLLFITDVNNSYYLEGDNGDSYHRLLSKYVSKFEESKVTFFGSSMSGYGALLHSTRLNTNAIVCNPQINYQSTFDNAWGDLKNTLRKIKNFIDLDIYLENKILESFWHISHGSYPMDLVNISDLQKSKLKSSKIIYQKIDDDNHGFYFKDTKSIYNLHFKLSDLRNINLIKL